MDIPQSELFPVLQESIPDGPVNRWKVCRPVTDRLPGRFGNGFDPKNRIGRCY
jgi:hypothetical protein